MVGFAKRLTKKSKAVRLLRAKFERGDLKGDEQPKTVLESETEFQKHKLQNFRTCYNALRLEFTSEQGEADTEDATTLDRRCSASMLNMSCKRRSSATVENDTDDSDGEEIEEGVGAEITAGALAFKPLFMISSWTELVTLAKRLSIAIVLPSGVGTGDFSITVVDGGLFLKLTVIWPRALLDVMEMHCWKLADPQSGIQAYHPSVHGFESALGKLGKRSSDAVESVARVPLPFQVQTQIMSKTNLSFRIEGTKMLYVDLKAALLDDGGVVADTETFREL